MAFRVRPHSTATVSQYPMLSALRLGRVKELVSGTPFLTWTAVSVFSPATATLVSLSRIAFSLHSPAFTVSVGCCDDGASSSAQICTGRSGGPLCIDGIGY